MTGMKALSMTQPWATLVAIGAKRIETRSWPTSYRGPLAIHAAKGFPREAIELCFEEPFARVLRAAGIRQPADLPRGAPRGYPDWDTIYAVTRAVFGEHVDAMMPIPREEAFIHGAFESQKRGRSRQVFHVVEMPQAWPREG